MVGEREQPGPSAGEVLVRVRATSLNAVDWYGFSGRPYIARPLMGLRKPKSSELGSDFAGVVEAIGDGVDGFAPGDEVYGREGGAFAEYVVASAAVERKPANLSFEQAAAVPIAGLTALQGLRDHGGVQPGQRVLINGAAGGVGTFAVQVAKLLGAEVHAVCSAAERRAGKRARRRSRLRLQPRGLHTQLRPLRRPVRQRRQSVVAVDAPCARAARNSGARRRAARTRLLGPLGHIVRIKLVSKVGGRTAVFFVAKPNREDLATLRELIEAGHVKPVIERRYEFAQIAEAMDGMSDGHARAKIVVAVP